MSVTTTPSGYKIHLEKHPGAPSWRIVGTQPEGTFCHKPCTVSGGGKSEISKSLRDYMLYGPIFVADLDKDFALVEEIFNKDYGNRWSVKGSVHPDYSTKASRPLLSPERTLGSVIKLLTPSTDSSATMSSPAARAPSRKPVRRRAPRPLRRPMKPTRR